MGLSKHTQRLAPPPSLLSFPSSFRAVCHFLYPLALFNAHLLVGSCVPSTPSLWFSPRFHPLQRTGPVFTIAGFILMSACSLKQRPLVLPCLGELPACDVLKDTHGSALCSADADGPPDVALQRSRQRQAHYECLTPLRWMFPLEASGWGWDGSPVRMAWTVKTLRSRSARQNEGMLLWEVPQDGRASLP